MALLMVGFGLGDSIRQIVNNQYKNIWIYDGELTLDEDLERTEGEALAAEVVEDYDNITQSMFVRQNSIDFEKDGITKSGYLFVPEYMDQVSDFLVLKNRVTQERYALSGRRSDHTKRQRYYEPYGDGRGHRGKLLIPLCLHDACAV